ncbi:MAG: hypothetical protein NC331_06750 [Lachnospiraceae bacterium]|nr:hypothetical protein [Lachnospiraceae bacterium]MCM1239069.1 hypothetical protein [Lachnospiraceae bacterium]
MGDKDGMGRHQGGCWGDLQDLWHFGGVVYVVWFVLKLFIHFCAFLVLI